MAIEQQTGGTQDQGGQKGTQDAGTGQQTNQQGTESQGNQDRTSQANGQQQRTQQTQQGNQQTEQTGTQQAKASERKGTIFDDAKVDPPGAPGSTTLPATWREDYAKGDEKKLNALKRYENLDAALNALTSLRGRIATGEYRRAMPKSDSPEDVKAWREESGLPLDKTGYEIVPAEAMEGMTDADKATVGMFQEDFFKNNVPPEVAKSLWKTAEAATIKIREAEAAADAARSEETEDDLRAGWGPDYRHNVTAIDTDLTKNLGPELADQFLLARTPDGRRLCDIPEVCRFMYERASAIGTDVMYDGKSGGATTIQSQIEDIQKIMQTDFARYEREGLDKKYYELVERRDRRAQQ